MTRCRPTSTGRCPRRSVREVPSLTPAARLCPVCRCPTGTVVLTFDDGPDPLDRPDPRRAARAPMSRPPSSWSAPGSAQRPDLMRRMYAEGHEVGVHTFTHANLANVPPWRQRIELDQTQLAIAAATGHTTSLLRPPYSSSVGRLDLRRLAGGPARRALPRRVHRPGHPGLGEARGRRHRRGRPRPPDDRGAIVMMHDGGGDRSQTVAALGPLIDRAAAARGYRSTPSSAAVGVAARGTRPRRHSVRRGAPGAWAVRAVLRRYGRGAAAHRSARRWPLAVIRTLLLAAAGPPAHACSRSAGGAGRASVPPGGVGDRPRVQRGAGHRGSGPVAGRPATIPTSRSSSSTTAPPTTPRTSSRASACRASG